MFASEKEMSKEFEKFIKKEFGNSYFKEQEGLFGVPDFILADRKSNLIISFELKLKNWKRATIQAFRYKSFSDISYVVLPSTNINSKEFSIEYFKKFNIGLAEFNLEQGFRIISKPQKGTPYSNKLNDKATTIIKSNRKRVKNIEFLIG